MSSFSNDDVRKALAYGVLPALSAVGFYGTMYHSMRNGLFKSLNDVVRGKTDVLPNTKSKVILKWTGIKVIDDYLALYLAFFLPGSTKSSPTMTMQNRHFITQFAAMWALLQLQMVRKESSPYIQAGLLLTGFGIQSIGAATIVPLFCALHLATSQLTSFNPLVQAGSISDARAASIPASTVLNIVLPLAASSFIRDSTAKQRYVNWFQVFYLFSEAIDRFAVPALQSSFPNLPLSNGSSRVYAFAEALSVVPHVAIIGAILLSKIAPNLLPKGYDNLSFTKVFRPRMELEDKKDMMEARLHFLQWDQVISTGTFLLWAGAVYGLALPAGSMSSSDALKFGAKVLARALITGPVGAAAWLLRERDVLLA